MLKLIKLAHGLRKDEKGATAIEYGLLAALIAVFLITVLGLLGGGLQDVFQAVVDELEDAVD